jgi:methylthioxylose transferase
MEALAAARRRAGPALPAGSVRAAAAGLVVAAVAGGTIARHAGVDLGADTAPFFFTRLLVPAQHPLWPLAPLALAVVAALALDRATWLPAPAFVAAAFVLALGARLGLATAQRGVDEWWWPLVRNGATHTEYPAAYGLVARSPSGFVDHFAQLVPTLPVHPSAHPAGATLAFYALDRATGGARGSALALCAIGAAAVVPTLLLGRALADEQAARRAVLLFALAPATLLYGATSYDAAFVPLGVTAAWLFLTRRVVAGAVAATAGFLVSYALGLVPLYAALVAGGRRGVRIAAASALAALAALVVLWLALGYDPVHAVLATRRAYERGIGGRRPQWYWAVGGPAAFLVVLGPLLAERLLAAVERRRAAACALVACVALGAASGVMEAEVERIWQFLVPLAAVAAAPLVRSRRWLAVGLAVALAQAYVIELLWDLSF